MTTDGEVIAAAVDRASDVLADAIRELAQSVRYAADLRHADVTRDVDGDVYPDGYGNDNDASSDDDPSEDGTDTKAWWKHPRSVPEPTRPSLALVEPVTPGAPPPPVPVELRPIKKD